MMMHLFGKKLIISPIPIPDGWRCSNGVILVTEDEFFEASCEIGKIGFCATPTIERLRREMR